MKPLDRLSAEGYLLKMRRQMPAAVVGFLVGVLAAGCGLLPDPSAETCVDWVHFETPEQQFQEDGLVLIGKPVAKDGETSLYGYRRRSISWTSRQSSKGSRDRDRSASLRCP
jgi:hypothetical protein